MTEPAHDDDAIPKDETLRSLERRLRRLNWPEPPPGVRERTLDELKRKLAASNGDGAAAGADNGGTPAGDEVEAESAEPPREGPA